MEALELLIPLTCIPGVGLLIMSTSQRYMNVNALLGALTPEECRMRTERYCQELRRAHLFRNSLIGLYLSVVFFSLGSLVAFLLESWGIHASSTLLEIGTIIGVAAIVFAVFNLIVESILTLDILKRHHWPDRDEAA